MAGYCRLLVVCLLAWTTVTAAPQRDGNCMAAGEVADKLFRELVSTIGPMFDMPEMFSKVLNIDYDTFTFTKILCRLEGVESVDGVMASLHDSPDRLGFKMIKGLYDALVANSKYEKKAWTYSMEQHPSEGVPYPLDLLRALEASNMTNLDPEGVAWMIEAIKFKLSPPWSDVELPDPEPLSTQSRGQQCTDITNILRKRYNDVIKRGPFGDADVNGVYYRDELYDQTGIFLPPGPQAYQEIRYIVCQMLELSTDLESLYRFVFYGKYFNFVFSKEYERLSYLFKRKYLGDDTNGNGFSQVNVNVQNLVGLLNDMGLLDLQLMTDMYPYPGQPFVNPHGAKGN